MNPDDDVCLCFHVSLRKIRAFLERENPSAASQISECLGAGTGCHWCVPYLKHLHEQHQRGQMPTIDEKLTDYAEHRADYRQSGKRDDS